MGLFGKMSEAEGVLALADRFVKLGPFVLGLGGFGGGGAWATYAVEAFAQYSPFSWVFGGFVGALIFSAVYWLWSVAKMNVARAEYVRNHAAPKDAINPLEMVFTRQTIDVNSFRGPLNEPVDGKTFIGCDLDGPAVICFVGSSVSISGVSFGACDFVLARSGAQPNNAIAFANATIQGGRIRRMTILVQPQLKALFEHGFNTPVDWLNNPIQQAAQSPQATTHGSPPQQPLQE